MATLFLLLSVEGTLPDGIPVRKALNTGSWELATEMARAMETGGPTAAVTIAAAVQRFLADAAARHLSEAALKKYRVLLQGRRATEKTSPTLEEYAEETGYTFLKQLDVDTVRDFRQRWKDGSVSARRKLERLRAFFQFAADAGWIPANPATTIKPPVLREAPTMSLDDDEIETIYAKIPALVADRKEAARGQAAESDHLERLKALLLVLEHTGLRIIDAVQLNKKHIVDGRLILRAQKNQGEINLPVPPHVQAELVRLRFVLLLILCLGSIRGCYSTPPAVVVAGKVILSGRGPSSIRPQKMCLRRVRISSTWV
ncbi:MAG TPA: hypothetical protein VGF59_27350 [Bryobacteraceae bacterium]